MIALVLFLVIVGVALELLKTKLPIDSSIRVLIQVVIVIGVVYYLFAIFGVVDLPVPKLNSLGS